MTPLHEILQQRKLTALFQPMLNLESGEIVGFEGLIRGPANSPLHSPINLFGAAQRHGLSLETEMLSRQIVLETFAQLDLPGCLFLNVSPETLTHPQFRNGRTLDFMTRLGIAPDRVIIEITENQPTYDFNAMRSALLHYRSMGFQIALDDLGEGFSSLRLWSELRPGFVKIDMHFVQGVDTDPIKLQFLKSIQCIAESCGTKVIAEGVETEGELMVVKDIGIALGQGYFIARPSPAPPLVASAETARIINASQIAVFPKAEFAGRAHVTAQKLMAYIEPARPETENERIFERFSENPALRVIPIIQDGTPVGLINRYNFIDRFAKPYQRELFGKKSCVTAMQGEPLLVSKDMPIEELSHFIADADGRHFSDGFIITDQGRYIGLASGQDLLRELTKMQIEAARYANPLTLLPGNVPINEHIERLLNAATPFVICYCDLDNFKPFNDAYSYRKGDEMIQLAGRILGVACNPKLDFIGHIGGDDFILLMQSHDWEKRCHDALQSFAKLSSSLVSEPHRSAGGFESEDRNGKVVFHPLTTLSIGAVHIEPGKFISHHEVSAAATEAKKMAKRTPGSSLFIEQRCSPVPS
ncbi:MAG: GGDEF domain-containing protein [Gallionellaceae bacterium]|nr:GGDEF domain-containing protein [Gallionellaceae bacterium]